MKKPSMNSTPLYEKAVLVRLIQHHWGGRKADQAVSVDVAKRHEAKNNRIGTYHKWLVPREVLQDAATVRHDAYLYHLTNTLPWMDGGIRLLPAVSLQEYLDQMRKFQAAHDKAVQEFMKDYAEHVRLGMLALGKMADPTDYPPADDIARRFGLETIVMQLPATEDWRVNLPQAELNDLKAQAERDLQTLQADALRDLWQRMNDAVDRVVNRMSDKEAIFRNSLFENLKEVVAVVAKLNFAGDPALEAIRKEIEAKLAAQTPDVVRADPTLRKQVATDAAAIMQKMKTYLG